MMRIVLLICFITLCYGLSAQDSLSARKATKVKMEQDEVQTAKQVQQIAQRDAWLTKSFHPYIGLDILMAVRMNGMSYYNPPQGLHNYYNGIDAHNLVFRLYVGVILNYKNHIEMAIENIPTEVSSRYQTLGSPKTSDSYISTTTSMKIGSTSFAYKRDVLHEQKYFRLYPGFMIGLAYGSLHRVNAVSTYNIPSGNDTISISSGAYTSSASVFPIFGPILDCDVNIQRLTIGMKFRVYYYPGTVWGQNYRLDFNHQIQNYYNVSTAVFNFNWGIGARYTF